MRNFNKTRIVSLITLATTLAYYLSNSHSDIGKLTDVTITDTDIQELLSNPDEQSKTQPEQEHHPSDEHPQHIEQTKNGDVKKNQIEETNNTDNVSNSPKTSSIENETNPKVIVNTNDETMISPLQRSIKLPSLKPSGGKIYQDLDFSIISDEDRGFLEERSKMMIKRAKRIATVCKENKKLIRAGSLRLIWDTKHSPNILYCPIPKIASTTMMINFLRLVHFNENNPDLQKYDPEEREELRFNVTFGANHKKVFEIYSPPEDEDERLEIYENSLRVLIVRHPFRRILSAYRDKMIKLEPGPKQFNFRDLQQQIIDEYRPTNTSETSPFPTFKEFIQYILDSTQDFVTAADWKTIHCWRPYWVSCNVCGTDYNLVMKLETMSEDERFLITLSNLEELKTLKENEWRHLNNATSAELTPQYYSQLSKGQIRQLYQRYYLDFKLFGYRMDDIYQGRKKEET